MDSHGNLPLYIFAAFLFSLIHSDLLFVMSLLEIPDHLALSYTDKLAIYMVSRFQNSLLPMDNITWPKIPPLCIPMQTVYEANRMVTIISKVYQNMNMSLTFDNILLNSCPVTISNVDIIQLGEQIKRRGHLMVPLDTDEEEYTVLTEPAVVTDRSGYVLLWYLSGAISQSNQVSMSLSSVTILLTDQSSDTSGNSYCCYLSLFSAV